MQCFTSILFSTGLQAPPEEPEPWAGTRDATKEGAISPQRDFFTQKYAGEEDCLFLNVYTPQWAATTPKAVVVWIHGGAFIGCSGNMDLSGPDYFLAEDVVFVTLNYRLGALGFLYLDGSDISGNNGLRDPVMALKWVKNNIANFGGDPGNVTIFGGSAGGSSVHYLILSPLATGLFHRAIALSGTAFLCSCNAPRDISSQRAVRLAKALGCTSEEPQQVADFLRTVPAEKFVLHQDDCQSQEEKDRLLELPYCPTEEVGPEAFLPASARSLLREGRYNKVPLIIGVTSAEGKMMTMPHFLHTTLPELDQHFENVLPPELAPKIGTERSKEVASAIKKFYFGDKRLDDDTIMQYIDMMSDLMFVFPLYQTVKSQVKWSQHPTYVYVFDHMNESRLNFLTKTKDDLPGVIHGGDAPYVLYSELLKIDFPPGSIDAKVQAEWVKMWTNFAKTGNPSNDLSIVTWIPAEKGKLNYLKINEGFKNDTDMFQHRMKFLEELYLKYLSH